MDKRNFFQILGVERDATEQEIKQAYRKLAKQYHPDTHPDDKVVAEKMKEINVAYDMVGDNEKRSIYLRNLEQRESQPAKPGPKVYREDFTAQEWADFDPTKAESWETIFGTDPFGKMMAEGTAEFHKTWAKTWFAESPNTIEELFGARSSEKTDLKGKIGTLEYYRAGKSPNNSLRLGRNNATLLAALVSLYEINNPQTVEIPQRENHSHERPEWAKLYSNSKFSYIISYQQEELEIATSPLQLLANLNRMAGIPYYLKKFDMTRTYAESELATRGFDHFDRAQSCIHAIQTLAQAIATNDQGANIAREIEAIQTWEGIVLNPDQVTLEFSTLNSKLEGIRSESGIVIVGQKPGGEKG